MAARQRMGVGIIGAGNISSQYLKAMKDFAVLDIRAIADMRPEVAASKAAEFGVKTKSVEALLADPSVDIIVNLTIPRAHVEVGLRAIAAGKHVYGEKPLGVTFAEGKKLVAAAKRKGVRVGSAPDTFLGGGHQQARAVIDSGRLGTIIGGTAFFAVPGHEYWHPDPAFYYDIGGGPVLDMGAVLHHRPRQPARPGGQGAGDEPDAAQERADAVGAQEGPDDEGEGVHPRHRHAAVRLGRDGQVTLSFDVPKHSHLPIEIYGTRGLDAGARSQHVRRRGQDRQAARRELGRRAGDPALCRRELSLARRRRHGATPSSNDRPHRASGELALHVLEVMEAFETGQQIGRDRQDQDPGRAPGADEQIAEGRQDFLIDPVCRMAGAPGTARLPDGSR